jgi:hypothetical protein
MSESSPDDLLSWEDLIYLADLFHRAGERRISLLGGEPTLHPAFNDMVAYLLVRDFRVTVFTSGVMAERTLQDAATAFRNVAPDRLSFVCNLNDPAQTRSTLAEQESVKRFLSAFGDRTAPGFNIYRLDFSLDFLFDLINRYGMRRHIRIGLTHPIVGMRNRHIALNDLDTVITRLFSFCPQFEDFQVTPGLDCGFPMCRFSDEQLAWLYRHTGGKSEFGCGPVLDIGPDMCVWSCFPLSGIAKRSVYEFDSLPQMYEYYADFHRKIKVEAGGILPACDTCLVRAQEHCKGGCLAHNLNAFRLEERVRVPEVYS